MIYLIINTQTDSIVGQAKTLRGALRSIDRKDNAYGACIHTYEKVKG